MTSKNLKILFACIVLAAASATFSYTAVSAVLYSKETEIVLPASSVDVQELAEIPSDELPKRLLVPILGIDTNVQHVGIAKSGNMSNPNNFTDVGWYKYGTLPGRKGSAVMAGHVDNALGMAGVFKRLQNLRPGDDIYVVTEKGTEMHFVVTESVSYNYDQVPTEMIFNQGDKPRLRLITCGGSWIQKNKTYDQRLVVTAERRS